MTDVIRMIELAEENTADVGGTKELVTAAAEEMGGTEVAVGGMKDELDRIWELVKADEVGISGKLVSIMMKYLSS